MSFGKIEPRVVVLLNRKETKFFTGRKINYSFTLNTEKDITAENRGGRTTT